MKLTAKVKLVPTTEQAESLKQTLETANAACNRISAQAWEHKAFGQFNLHNLTYHATRLESSLAAQVVVRCISKVTDAYKIDRKKQRVFSPHGSIAFDERILTWHIYKGITDKAANRAFGHLYQLAPLELGIANALELLVK